MFTGIIEEIGTVVSVIKGEKSSVLAIRGSVVFDGLKVGDSISVSGVCLTVNRFDGNVFTADVMSETLNCSTLGKLKTGSKINMERAIAANGRFGGHIVSGHIDGTGNITAIRKDDNAIWYSINAPQEIVRYIVKKGSICVDGISLTVAGLGENGFDVSVIPHTAAVTTLALKRVGDTVNLENDIIGKYIERFITIPACDKTKKTNSGITTEFLSKNGF